MKLGLIDANHIDSARLLVFDRSLPLRRSLPWSFTAIILHEVTACSFTSSGIDLS